MHLDLPEFALSVENRSEVASDRYLDRMLTTPKKARQVRSSRSKLRSSLATVWRLVVMAIGIIAIGTSLHWGLKLLAVDVSRDVVCGIVGILYLRK